MDLKESFLTEIMFFPPISVFEQWMEVDVIHFEAHEHYLKRSFRNCCLIGGGNDVERLIVPLKKGKNQQLAIQDVRISYDEDWRKKHLGAIKAAYGKSPFFIFYFDEIAAIYSKQYNFLWDLNLDALTVILKLLKWEKRILLTDKYEQEPHLLDLRNALNLKNYGDFKTQYYGQVFEDKYGFRNNLSILDHLFCDGGLK